MSCHDRAAGSAKRTCARTCATCGQRSTSTHLQQSLVQLQALTPAQPWLRTVAGMAGAILGAFTCSPKRPKTTAKLGARRRVPIRGDPRCQRLPCGSR